MAATPNCQIVESAVLVAFPDARFGRYNCRHIGSNPLRPWSQHAGSEPARRYFANALDIWHVDHKPAGKPADSSPAHQTWLRAVRGFITLNYGVLIDQMLGPGDNAAHANHIHMSTWPKMKSNWWYRPPCRGGTLIVIHEDGTTGNTFGDAPSPPPPPTNMEDDMWPLYLWDGADDPPADSQGRDWKAEDVSWLQKRVNRLHGILGRPRIATDKVLGPATMAAVGDLINLPLVDVIDGRSGERFGDVSIRLIAGEGSQGEKGDTGDAGPQGMTGAPGPQGDPGEGISTGDQLTVTVN